MLSSFRAVWERRELVSALVMRDLKARYRSSFLGFFWSILNPLLMMAVYTVVFQYYMRMNWGDPRPYSIFLLIGILPWTWFASSLTEGASSILSGGSIVKNIRFPSEILPLVVVLSNLIHFLIGLVLLFVFMVVSGMSFTIFHPLVILAIGIHFFFILGLTLVLSGMTVFFRDIQQLLINIMMLWFFLSPVIYKPEIIHEMPEWVQFFFYLNPMASILMNYHDTLFYGVLPPGKQVLISCGWALLAFTVGMVSFGRMRDHLAEGI